MVYTSWKHNPGEMRLYLENQEVVMHKSLAAHWRHRYQLYWKTEAPLIDINRFRRDQEDYERLEQARKYPVGEDVEENEALVRWAEPNRPRRVHHNRAGNQYYQGSHYF